MKTVCVKTISPDIINFMLDEIEKETNDFVISIYRFKTYDNFIVHSFDKGFENRFYKCMAKIIRKSIEKYYENIFIDKIVEKNYFYLNPLERKYINEISKKVLDLPDDKIGGKRKLLENIIETYIKENKKIVLEGFINFRIKDYKELLEKIVDVSVVSYLDLVTF